MNSARIQIVRENRPYDNGYWARYDGLPRPAGTQERQGWDACDSELRTEKARAAAKGAK